MCLPTLFQVDGTWNVPTPLTLVGSLRYVQIIQTRHHRSNLVSVELLEDWSNYAS